MHVQSALPAHAQCAVAAALSLYDNMKLFRLVSTCPAPCSACWAPLPQASFAAAAPAGQPAALLSVLLICQEMAHTSDVYYAMDILQDCKQRLQ